MTGLLKFGRKRAAGVEHAAGTPAASAGKQDRTVSMEGDSGAEVARNLQRLALGLVTLKDLGPAYVQTPQGVGIRVEKGTFPLDRVTPVADGHLG